MWLNDIFEYYSTLLASFFESALSYVIFLYPCKIFANVIFLYPCKRTHISLTIIINVYWDQEENERWKWKGI